MPESDSITIAPLSELLNIDDQKDGKDKNENQTKFKMMEMILVI